MAHKAIFFNFDRWGDDGKNYMLASQKLKDAQVEASFFDTILDQTHIPQATDADILGVFSDSTVDAPVIGALPGIKFITTLSTGYDHIDVKAAQEKGMMVASVPAYGENTVAEFAFALLLSFSRKVGEARARLRDERQFNTMGLTGFDLGGKTIGVIGTGHIGKHAIQMAKGFDMQVIAFDAYPDNAFAQKMNFTYVTLEELLAKSDIITIHCPYLPSTHHLINQGNVGLIKKGAYLINTARGAIVETAALIGALKSGQLGGAGLDVLEEEPAMKAGDMSIDRELIMMPNVIVTPHNAFNTKEAFIRILDTTIDNIVGFVNGTPINTIK